MSLRVERDFLGEIAVPADRLWGAQTQRAIESFPIGTTLCPAELIRGIAAIKRAAARVHGRRGALPPRVAEAIDRAAAEVASGEHDDHFPLPVWQSGSGTQTHMNVNEVVARRATAIAGGDVHIHPMLVTALVPHIGYDRAAAIAREAHASGRTLRDVAVASGAVTGAQFDELVDPAALV